MTSEMLRIRMYLVTQWIPIDIAFELSDADAAEWARVFLELS